MIPDMTMDYDAETMNNMYMYPNMMPGQMMPMMPIMPNQMMPMMPNQMMYSMPTMTEYEDDNEDNEDEMREGNEEEDKTIPEENNKVEEPSDTMRSVNEDDELNDSMRASNEDEILRKIEKNNPMIIRRLMSCGMPYPMARNYVKRIISLTLKYYR